MLGRYTFLWRPRSAYSTAATVSSALRHVDPELHKLVREEQERQKRCVTLIASENYTPRYCSEVLASCLAGKYSEGYPGSRYYAGNNVIDKIETLCQQRALDAFRLNSSMWKVNVQPHSGSGANFAVYNALLNPGASILHLRLSDGGHLSHGHRVKTKKITATSKYFDASAYTLHPTTELIDYFQIAELAKKQKPKLIIAGYSAYPRLLDYKKFRDIADSSGSILMADIAHISGMMAAGLIPSAFDYCDVVTTTTHKSLRGPRGALIFSQAKFSEKIDRSVFPGCQGGPHNHSIGAIAAALKVASGEEFKGYQRTVLEGAQVLADKLKSRGFRLVTGGTDNHMVLVDLTDRMLSGSKAEKALEAVNIISNKNAVLTDTSVRVPHGLRLGTPAMVTRGFEAKDFAYIGDEIAETLQIAQKLDGQKGKLFAEKCGRDRQLAEIRSRVIKFVEKFPMVAEVGPQE